MGSIVRKVGRAVLYFAAALVPPLAVVGASFFLKTGALGADAGEPLQPAESRPAQIDPARPVVVILLSNFANEVTDFLPPYQLFVTAARAQVVTVAPERLPAPVYNGMLKPAGLAVAPDLSFAEYDEMVGRAPDAILIPYYPGFTPEREAAIVAWIRRQAGPTTRLVSVCAGAQILAATGLLDGRRATTHQGWIDQLTEEFPRVRWERGLRYAVDGNMITAGGLASGIDATLAAIDRLFGRDVALAVATSTGYARTKYLDDPRRDPGPVDPRAMPDALLRPTTLRVATPVYDGVDDSFLAAVLDASLIEFASTYAVAPSRNPVRTRSGMTLLPPWTYAEAPSPDRLVVAETAPAEVRAAATQFAQRAGAELRSVPIGPATFGYDAVLGAIGTRSGRMIAEATANNLVYPAETLELGPGRLSPGMIGLLLCAAAGVGLLRLLRRRPGLST